MDISSPRQQEQVIRTATATDAAAPSPSVQTSAPSATVGQKPIRAARASDLQLYGTPGTLPSLVLRAVQFLAAALALAAMVSADDFFTVPGFSFLVAATAVQAIWSFSLGILDVDAMISKSTLANHWIASLFIFGDTFTGAATFCGASAASGVVIYIHYDVQTCAKEHCDKFQAAVTRTFISFAALVPSLWVNWIRSCASTVRRTPFPADQLLLYSNGVCSIVATIALLLYAGDGAGRIRCKAFSFSVIASSMQLGASALGFAGQMLSRHFGSATPVPDWPLFCASVIAVQWFLAFWTAGTACACAALLQFFMVNGVYYTGAVNVRAVAFAVLSLAVGALATIAACSTSHLAIRRWLRRRAQNQ